MAPHANIRSNLKVAFLVLLLLGSGFALTTAFEIEYLNWKSGGAIEQKARQEPHSKWRVGEGFHLARKEVESEFRAKYAIEPEASLSPAQHEEVRELARARHKLTPRDQLGTLLHGRALLQIPLGIFLVVGGFVGFLYAPAKVQERIHFFPLGIGLSTLFLAFYRDYLGAVGW